MHTLLPETTALLLREFNGTGDYFECHELLEEAWKAHPGRSKSDPITGLILLATGCYHWRRGNRNGARKSLAAAAHRLASSPCECPLPDGRRIDWPLLVSLASRAAQAAEEGAAFCAFCIPLEGEPPARPPRVTDPALIERHRLRDRSEVHSERERAKNRRRADR